MKVTFIDPPNLKGRKGFERVFGCTYSLYPIPNIFSLSAASVLDKNGHGVAYLDMSAEAWNAAKIRRFLASDDSLVYVLHSINLSMDSDMVFHRLIRESSKRRAVVFCGPAPTYFANFFLKDRDTFAVRGETEVTLLELVRSLSAGKGAEGVEGVSFLRQDGSQADNPPRPLLEELDSLPFPCRRLLNRDLYYNPKLELLPFTAVQTSRNCSYQCVFCVPNSYNFARELEHRRYHQDQKPAVRLRSARNVILEFEELRAQGYKSVSIIDDQFLWSEERSLAICEGLKQMGMRWGCLARADRITDEVAAALKAAGCVYLDMGVESFDQEVLDDAHKGLDVAKIYEAVKILKKHGILVKINLVLGLSRLQDRSRIIRDIRTAKKLDVDMVMFSLATPFPGTELYKIAKNGNLFIGEDYVAESVQSKAVISYPGLSAKNLNRLVRYANLSFYLRPRVLFKNIGLLASPVRLYRSLTALRRKFL